MKRCFRCRLRPVFDLRTLVLICGMLLSIAMHELFHIIIHWGEIERIHIFPDSEAIVRIILTPSAPVHVALEEVFAYGVTMVTLVLTAMLIGDIQETSDPREKKPVLADILTENEITDARKDQNQLALILNIL